MQSQELERILSDLFSLLSRGRKNDPYAHAWREIMTESEQVQLAKRCAIILLLKHGASTADIERALMVSSATVFKHYALLEQGTYASLVGLACRQHVSVSVAEILDAILTLNGFLPHYAERNRWKHFPRS